MGGVLDFGAAVLDGSGYGHVTYADFDQVTGFSPVYRLTARSDSPMLYRPSPNDLTVFSNSVRVGLSASDCLAASWGDSLAIALDRTYSGFPVYVQFRRPLDGSAIAFDNVLGMIDSGFIAVPTAVAIGNMLSAGVGSAVAHPPVSAIGNTLSDGQASATQSNPAVADGNVLSAGLSAAVQVNPASSDGNMESAGIAAASAVVANAAAGAGNTQSGGVIAGAVSNIVSAVGNTTSGDQAAGVQVNPASAEGNTNSSGQGAATVTPQSYTITIQPDATASKDTCIYSGSTANNYGVTPNMFFGDASASVSGAGRPLIAMPLSDILDGDTVIDAKLCVYEYNALCTRASGTTDDAKLYFVHRDWGEGAKNAAAGGSGEATWAKYDGTNAWGTAGCGNTTSDRSGTASSITAFPRSTTPAKDWVEFTGLGADVSNMRFDSGNYPNYGWVGICADKESLGTTATDARYFCSSDYVASNWAGGAVYAVGDLRVSGGTTYRCLTAHTGGTFATDLAANKWVAFDPRPKLIVTVTR